MPRVLIVDDISLNRILLEQILQPRGFETLSAAGGSAAVAIARDERPDLILMDIQMPDLTGYEALDLLREGVWTRNIPIMAVTGNATANDRTRLDNAGFNAALTKPFQINELMRLVKELTSASAA